MALWALALAAAAAGQEPAPTPCPAESSPASPETSARNGLLASDLAAASHDERRAAELLAGAAGLAGGAPLSPPDLLVLARREESRGDFTSAAAHYRQYAKSLEGTAEDLRWVEPRAKVLDLASRAAGSDADPEARLALTDGRASLARGDRKAAREKIGYAMRLDGAYAEAAIAAGSLDAMEGHKAEAVRDYRQALAADPERVEAIVPLSNLLWEHPDRASKAESLLLLDRAAAARSDLPQLQRRAAERYAEWGDPRAALERLDDWRSGASAAERGQTDALRAELAARLPPQEAARIPANPDSHKTNGPRARAARESGASDSGVWIWGAGVGVLVAAGAAVLLRRRRERSEEPFVPPATTTAVDAEELSRFLRSAASERQVPPPLLLTRGFPEEGKPPWTVRVSPPNWEALWKSVFGATLAAVQSARVASPKLSLSASLARDSSIAGLAVRFALADNAPGTLTTEMIRGRTAGPVWAAVDEAIRKSGGSIAVAASIDKQFTKRLLIEIPAV